MLKRIAAVALLLSLLLNAVLLFALWDAFGKLQTARMFPLGYDPDGQPPAKAVPTAHSIAFWGDSRAYLWDTRALAGNWAVQNFAHGGQTSAQLLLQLQTTPKAQSEVSIVQIGINDLHPLGVMVGRQAEIVARLRTNLIEIRNQLLARSDVVILTTIFPPGPVPLLRRLAWDPNTRAYIAEVNNELRRVAAHDRVVLVDAYAALDGGSSELAAGFADTDFFLHLNAAGYARLNSEVARVLEARRIQP